MKGLLQDISYNNGGIPTVEKKFFYILRGEKTAAKQLILSKCLLLCALKWRKTSEKEKGKIYQPSTFVQYIKQLFGRFHKKQIKYCYKSDFNGDGEFHAVIKRLWEREIAKDPKFATGVNTSSFDNFRAPARSTSDSYRNLGINLLIKSNSFNRTLKLNSCGKRKIYFFIFSINGNCNHR
jgi:hypothetical protein